MFPRILANIQRGMERTPVDLDALLLSFRIPATVCLQLATGGYRLEADLADND